MQTNELCPCGSKKSYQECCADFHQEIRLPTCAEELMRSRYSAFALKNIDYINNTMTGPAAHRFNPEQAKQNQSLTQWLGLDVINSTTDKKNPNHAFVEFRALHNTAGKISILQELSEFTKINNRWFYINGQSKKSSRNDPCPCHSGKKFKQCHG